VTGLVAVAIREPAALALVDGRTGRVRRRVPLPGAARHVALAGPGGPALVTAEDAGAFVRVTLPRGEARRTALGPRPHQAARVGPRVVVAEQRGDAIDVIEPHGAVRRRPVAAQPDGVAAVEEGRAVAVLSARERVLELYDPATLRRLAAVPAGSGPTHLVGDGRDLLYVADTTGGALLAFHLRPRLELTRRVYLPPAPYGLAYDARRHRIWATLTGNDEVVEIAAGPRPRPLRVLPAVRQPDSVAVDERTGRVFVTGRADGVLQRFDPSSPRARSR
jgi:DNA-binding beta-propeller fold protein YncE